MVIDGVAGTVRNKTDKAVRLSQAARWLVGRPSVSAKLVQKFLGHFIHAGLLSRDLLSLPRALYDFCSVHTTGCHKLWPFAARECFWISCLALDMSANLRLEWSPRVSVSDACLTGVAVSCSDLRPLSSVQHVGRVSEKWRFKAAAPSLRSRDHALAKGMDVFGDLDSVRRLKDADPFPSLEFNPEFIEVPGHLLVSSLYKSALSYPIRRSEKIGVLESRGKVSAAKHVAFRG